MSKKKMWTYLIICFILLFCCVGILVYELGCTNGVYRIEISSRCISNNSVGNDWIKTYTMDGETINNRFQIVAPIDTKLRKTIKVKITERDSIPDIAYGEINFYLKDGEIKKSTITVTEKNGRYRGNTALWEIEVSVKFIKKTMKKA